MLQSPVDIALIAGVVLLIFGPKKLPEMGKALGLGIGNFKKALFEGQEEGHAKASPDSTNSVDAPMVKSASGSYVHPEVATVGAESKSDVNAERKTGSDEPLHSIS
jgi:sec-independent protein translocase protein TatA